MNPRVVPAPPQTCYSAWRRTSSSEDKEPQHGPPSTTTERGTYRTPLALTRDVDTRRTATSSGDLSFPLFITRKPCAHRQGTDIIASTARRQASITLSNRFSYLQKAHNDAEDAALLQFYYPSLNAARPNTTIALGDSSACRSLAVCLFTMIASANARAHQLGFAARGSPRTAADPSNLPHAATTFSTVANPNRTLCGNARHSINHPRRRHALSAGAFASSLRMPSISCRLPRQSRVFTPT